MPDDVYTVQCAWLELIGQHTDTYLTISGVCVPVLHACEKALSPHSPRCVSVFLDACYSRTFPHSLSLSLSLFPSLILSFVFTLSLSWFSSLVLSLFLSLFLTVFPPLSLSIYPSNIKVCPIFSITTRLVQCRRFCAHLSQTIYYKLLTIYF